MSILDRIRGSFRKRSSLDADIDEEQRHHLELAVKDLVENQGLDPKEAQRVAAVRFGSRVEAREETRKQDLLPWLDTLGRDLRISWRGLRRSPSYSLIVLLALALGIGANTAIYSVIHAALFRPMPYPNPDEVAFIYTKLANGRRTWANVEDIQDWARDSKSFRSIAAWTSQTVNLTGTGEPDRLRGGFVSENFFSTLGVLPMSGRSFLGSEVIEKGPRVAIASWGLWQQKFGGDAGFLGSKVLLNGEPYTIVGILPRTFDFPLDRIDVWMPFQAWPAYRPDRGSVSSAAIGRLAPGATMASAEKELVVRIRALAAQYPDTNRDRIGAKVVPFRELLVEDLRSPLLLLGGAVLMALLVACANIATLTVSRVIARTRELGIRAALGAGRARLMWHLFSEQLLLSSAGGGLGLLLAYWFTQAMASSDLFPSMMAPRVEWPVALTALGLAMLTAVLTGPLPAIPLLRGKAMDVTAAGGGRSSGDAPTAHRTRRLLVTVSIAVSVVLLASAGLLVRSFETVAGVELGFDAKNLLTLEYRMPVAKYPNGEQQVEFHRQIAAKVATVPGVRSTTVLFALPFSGNGMFAPYEVVGQAAAAQGSQQPRAQINRVDSRYFETMGIPLLLGRSIEASDRTGSRRVVVITKSMAERCWPGQDPLNRQLILARSSNTSPEPYTVIGVVGDSKHSSLEEESRDKAYVAFAQHPHIFGTLAVRTNAGVDPLSLAQPVRKAVWEVDSDQPVWKVRTMEALVEISVTNRRLLAQWMSGFSVFALLLATIGLYGVISYSVARRAKELGIRAALGATRGGLVSLVIGDGMRNIALGLALGLLGTIPASTLVRTQLFQIRVTEAGPYLVAVTALIVASLLATAIPARRAASIDLAIILRGD
jgi:putative ABC transport system permease protein